MTLSRRELFLGSVTASVVALTGCAANAGPTTDGTASPVGDGFPVTLDHKFGSTTIESPPQRVVSIGYTDLDPLLALGIPVVAARYWFGDKSTVVQPWATAAAQAAGANPQVLTMDSIQAETIAELAPDLIVGVYSDLDENSYAQVSQIANTIGPPPGFVDYGVPWQDTTRFIARAVGREQRGAQLVSDLEQRFASVKGANPQWSGKQVAVASYATTSSGGIDVFSSADARSRFFTTLGFTVPAEYDTLAGQKFYANFSVEQADKLDHDLLVWDQVSDTPGGKATIEKDPLIANLKVTKHKRSIFLAGNTDLAFTWQTVLSIPAALNGIQPLVERALPAK